MLRFLDKFEKYFEPKTINMIEKCFALSIVMCLVSLLLLSYYNMYYISHLLFDTSITLFRTSLMIGLFPIAFTLIIGKWKDG